ncbi:hypothetical protein OF83DRAFT_1156413 [Amylostereum chailletii]|nr:hypothetical protein OF83DRAFT_1156413 [Amylostereum chailletii]
MAVFNPKMLDASVRDVVSALSSDQKTDVLLYAMERISPGPKFVPYSHWSHRAAVSWLSLRRASSDWHMYERVLILNFRSSRTTIENAVQSVLQVAAARPDKLIQARLIRAKARFAAGMRGAAHQDLQMILQIDPNHREATSLMPSGVKCITGEFGSRLRGQPRFSNEIWREVASYLAKRDLRSLLLVPHVLSSIASQFLFRRVHLHFCTASPRSQENSDLNKIDEWHARRSAEILSHLVSDLTYAGCVESLVIFAPEKENGLTSFQIVMISNILPKLKNLKTFGCRMSGRAMQTLLTALETSHPNLQSLILEPTTPLPRELPAFPALRRFACLSRGSTIAPSDIPTMISGQSIALRNLVVLTGHPLIDARPLPVNNLTSLDLDMSFGTPDALVSLLSDGRHLETLRIHCRLTQDVRLSAFVRTHPHLRTLRLSSVLGAHNQVGYNAVVWSVLPTLAQLENLSMDIPRDLTPALASWLIPRKVTSLHLRFSSPADPSFIAHLWSGLPKGIKLLAIPALELSEPFLSTVHSHLPKLDLLVLGSSPFSILHAATGIGAEEWSTRRRTYCLADGLEATEVDPEFAPWVGTRLPWHW